MKFKLVPVMTVRLLPFGPASTIAIGMLVRASVVHAGTTSTWKLAVPVPALKYRWSTSKEFLQWTQAHTIAVPIRCKGRSMLRALIWCIRVL